MSGDRPTATVIGSGVAGITAAYLLQRRFDVTLLEADNRLGGHADTHDVIADDGRWLTIDTGFIVHNRTTYPNLSRLLDELGVHTTPTEMSMSISCRQCGLEYAGGRGLAGVFAQPRRVLQPRHWRMLTEIRRFQRHARVVLDADPRDVDTITLAGFIAVGGYSRYFVNHYLLPLVSTVWSSGTRVAGEYPARYLFQFLDRHRMLAMSGNKPAWRTIDGGSREYVQRTVKHLSAVQTSTEVRAVTRHPDGVDVVDRAGRVFQSDRVVIATHPDQALAMLTDATATEQQILGSLPYATNRAVLHTDRRELPSARGARASWNYRVQSCGRRTDAVSGVSYYMNRLHRLDEPVEYVVSLNPDGDIDPSTVLCTRTYHHPVYTVSSVAARGRLPEITQGCTGFAGAYHGWGFHEDGCASGVAVAAAFGVPW